MAKIVVGIDGSDASKKALAWAIEEARLRQVPVLAVHAWEPPPPVTEMPLAPMAPPRLDGVEAVTGLEEAANHLVESVVREVAGDAADVEVTAEAREGPSRAILVEAAEADDLLVIGSRGRGGFAALLLGSVSHYCAHHAPCPVVIHRNGRD